MTLEHILSTCDHTLLSVSATWADIRAVLDDAMHFGTASACIPPYFVKAAKEYVGDRLAICTVIGFPNGYATTATKVYETADAIQNGADEIDMVITVGALKDKKYDEIEDEIRQIKAACGEHILKVIIETCLLTEQEKIAMCGIVTRAGADFIKTSTGFSTAGATFEDIALFREHIGEGVRMKAAGGIASLDDAETFLQLGASRLGTSRIVKIAKSEQGSGY